MGLYQLFQLLHRNLHDRSVQQNSFQLLYGMTA